MSWFSSHPSWKKKNPDTLPVKELVKRVSRDDIAAVTPEEIYDLKASMTREELVIAVTEMLESNRFEDVLECSCASSWRAASEGITPLDTQVAGGLFIDKLSRLYAVLPYVSADFLTLMTESFGGNM